MKTKTVNLIAIGICFSGFFAVALGAFGAHALKGKITPELLPVFETGNKYHFYHTLSALFAFLFLFQPEANLGKNELAKISKSIFLFLFGNLIFAGSLYILAITGIRWLGAITPIGGVSYLIGWIFLGWGLYSLRVP